VKYLLDTGVVAAAVRGRLPVVLKLSQLKPGDVAMSAVTRMQAEVALRTKSRSARLLREWVGAVRTLDFGVREAQQAGAIAALAQAGGEKLSGFDLLVAATALAHQLTLVTERVEAFAGVPNLEVENWK
jgi:tRNA(fMet)-specific endonuclease VapC